MKQRILLLDDDPEIAYQRVLILGMHGIKVDVASNLAEAREKRLATDYNLILVDIRDQQEADAALEWCEETHEDYPHQQFAVLAQAYTHVPSDCPDEVIEKDGPAHIVECVKRLLETAPAGS